MKCCKIPDCVSESCCPYENCEGGCQTHNIEVKDGFYILKVPEFVFESDIEFAKSQASRVFTDLYRYHNDRRNRNNQPERLSEKTSAKGQDYEK